MSLSDPFVFSGALYHSSLFRRWDARARHWDAKKLQKNTTENIFYVVSTHNGVLWGIFSRVFFIFFLPCFFLLFFFLEKLFSFFFFPILFPEFVVTHVFLGRP